jgi:hypothetical protein
MQNRIEVLEAERERLKDLLKNYSQARWHVHASPIKRRLWNVEADLARLCGRPWPWLT